MLTKVQIENYRGFKSYRLEGLTTVNLLVGKNNCGKTALLEAVEFLASGGDPNSLQRTASRRGEILPARLGRVGLYDFSHLFHGHKLADTSSFALEGETTGNGERVRWNVGVQQLADVEYANEAVPQDQGVDHPTIALRIDGPRGGLSSGPPGPATVLLTHLEARRYWHGRWIALGPARREWPSIVFIDPESLRSISLTSMWDWVQRERREQDVHDALRILEPRLEDVRFGSADLSRYRPHELLSADRVGVLIGFMGERERIPLGSTGDGMRRLLALAIALVCTSGKYLLIDEIDTGFHYSIMAKMWELVVRTALKSNTQVFATTHSADCVRGLGVLCKTFPELQAAVSAHKIVSDLEQSVTLTGSEVVNALEHEIEIR